MAIGSFMRLGNLVIDASHWIDSLPMDRAASALSGGVLLLGLLAALLVWLCTDPSAADEEDDGYAEVGDGYEAARVPIHMQLVLERLRGGYYRQRAAVQHDIDLIVQKHHGTRFAPLAAPAELLFAPARCVPCSSRRSRAVAPTRSRRRARLKY